MSNRSVASDKAIRNIMVGLRPKHLEFLEEEVERTGYARAHIIREMIEYFIKKRGETNAKRELDQLLR